VGNAGSPSLGVMTEGKWGEFTINVLGVGIS